MNKRGMSQIVTTVIIVVLVLVAIGIVWGVVGNLISESSDDISLGQFTINLEIQNAYKQGTDEVVVKIVRKVGEGDLTGLKFIVDDGSSSQVFDEESTLEQLDSDTFVLTITDLTFDDIEDVSVAALYSTGTGKDTLGGVSDTSDVGDSGSVVEGGGEPGEDCGNSVIDDGEECDTDDLGDYTTDCSTHPDFTGGDLSCLEDCNYNTDLCTGAVCTIPSSQDCSLTVGVCTGIQQDCEGDPAEWPGCDAAAYLAYNSSYEVTEVNCTDGYDNDCNGLTDNEEVTCELTWVGTVGDPWPTETKILFDIVETTADFVTPAYIYTGMYVGFSGTSIETRCLQIYDYVTPDQSEIFDKAILRVDDNPAEGLPINITGADTFTIYQKSECGA